MNFNQIYIKYSNGSDEINLLLNGDDVIKGVQKLNGVPLNIVKFVFEND